MFRASHIENDSLRFLTLKSTPQLPASQAESDPRAYRHSVGISYSTHFTALPSNLTSIAELINSFPSRYRMAAWNIARWTDGTTFGTITIKPACNYISEKSRNEIDSVVGDECEFIFCDPLGQFPVRLAIQAKVIDVGCFETGAMSDSDQRVMQAFVDQDPHALLSREFSAKDFLPRAFFPRQGRLLGRPLRGKARMYSGAMAILSLLRVG